MRLNKKVQQAIIQALLEFKKQTGIEGEPMDGDAVDELTERIKRVINVHEANT